MTTLQPLVATATSPVAEPVRRTAPVGVTIASTCPDLAGPWMCRLNGEWILRADWERRTELGDAIEWVTLVGDDSFFRTALQLAVMYVAYTVGGPLGAVINVVGNLAINAIFAPDVVTPGQTEAPSPTYSASLSGNAARLDQPIPDAYGYNRHNPDFAAQPYQEYDAAGDQFYHALLCIGYGSYAIKRILLDDTPLANFAGVTWRVLGPGVAPTLVNPAVVTAAEVAGQDLLTNQIVGPIAACQPRRLASSVGVDFEARALGVANNDGSMGERSVVIRIDVQAIDDFGQPLGGWTTLGTETITAATISPVRRSFRYTLAAPIRPLVRVTRTDEASDDHRVYDDIQWTGLRAYLAEPAPLAAGATHLEIRIKANEQLSGLSQRRIAVTAHRLVRTWTPGAGWSGLVETRNPAWALANKWRDTVTGDGRPDTEIDLTTLYALAQVWEARQDRFDYVFDTRQESRRADQVIARAGRAIALDRGGVLTVVRDQWDALPARVFTGRNITPGSWHLSYDMPRSDSAQGIRVEYLDYRSWDWESIDCPAPGHVPTALTRWEIVRLAGIIGPAQAEREGRFLAAALLYRRERAEWACEAEGGMVVANSLVRFAPPAPRWASAGDIVAWDAATRTATLSEPAGSGSLIVLVDDTGTATAPIGVSAVSGEPFQVVLAADPGFPVVTADARRERTRYAIGSAAVLGQVVRVRSVTPAMREFGEAPQCQIAGFVDDVAVHNADVSLLPGPGDTQDAIDAGDDASGSGSTPTPGGAIVVRLDGANLVNQAFGTGTYYAGVRVATDGRLLGFWNAFEVGPWGRLGREWITAAPVAEGVAAGYEVLAINEPVGRWETVEVGDGSASVWVSEPGTLRAGSDAVGAWLPITATREWVAQDSVVHLQLSIREAATGLVQDSALYVLGAAPGQDPLGGGGGGPGG